MGCLRTKSSHDLCVKKLLVGVSHVLSVRLELLHLNLRTIIMSFVDGGRRPVRNPKIPFFIFLFLRYLGFKDT
jgi:hypothetical protein